MIRLLIPVLVVLLSTNSLKAAPSSAQFPNLPPAARSCAETLLSAFAGLEMGGPIKRPDHVSPSVWAVLDMPQAKILAVRDFYDGFLRSSVVVKAIADEFDSQDLKEFNFDDPTKFRRLLVGSMMRILNRTKWVEANEGVRPHFIDSGLYSGEMLATGLRKINFSDLELALMFKLLEADRKFVRAVSKNRRGWFSKLTRRIPKDGYPGLIQPLTMTLLQGDYGFEATKYFLKREYKTLGLDQLRALRESAVSSRPEIVKILDHLIDRLELEAEGPSTSTITPNRDQELAAIEKNFNVPLVVAMWILKYLWPESVQERPATFEVSRQRLADIFRHLRDESIVKSPWKFSEILQLLQLEESNPGVTSIFLAICAQAGSDFSTSDLLELSILGAKSPDQSKYTSRLQRIFEERSERRNAYFQNVRPKDINQVASLSESEWTIFWALVHSTPSLNLQQIIDLTHREREQLASERPSLISTYLNDLAELGSFELAIYVHERSDYKTVVKVLKRINPSAPPESLIETTNAFYVAKGINQFALAAPFIEAIQRIEATPHQAFKIVARLNSIADPTEQRAFLDEIGRPSATAQNQDVDLVNMRATRQAEVVARLSLADAGFELDDLRQIGAIVYSVPDAFSEEVVDKLVDWFSENSFSSDDAFSLVRAVAEADSPSSGKFLIQAANDLLYRSSDEMSFKDILKVCQRMTKMFSIYSDDNTYNKILALFAQYNVDQDYLSELMDAIEAHPSDDIVGNYLEFLRDHDFEHSEALHAAKLKPETLQYLKALIRNHQSSVEEDLTPNAWIELSEATNGDESAQRYILVLMETYDTSYEQWMNLSRMSTMNMVNRDQLIALLTRGLSFEDAIRLSTREK